MDHLGNRNQGNGNLSNVFWRTALGILFLYLNLAAYQLLGIEGVAVTSGFFLIAQFAPFFMRIFEKHRNFQLPQTPEIFSEQCAAKQSAKVIPFRLVSQAEQKGL